jgi:hypothetical protein
VQAVRPQAGAPAEPSSHSFGPNKEIASALGIGEETVQTHVSNILSKLHLADRTQAAIYGLQKRLVPLDEALEEPGGGL